MDKLEVVMCMIRLLDYEAQRKLFDRFKKHMLKQAAERNDAFPQ